MYRYMYVHSISTDTQPRFIGDVYLYYRVSSIIDVDEIYMCAANKYTCAQQQCSADAHTSKQRLMHTHPNKAGTYTEDADTHTHTS